MYAWSCLFLYLYALTFSSAEAAKGQEARTSTLPQYDAAQQPLATSNSVDAKGVDVERHAELQVIFKSQQPAFADFGRPIHPASELYDAMRTMQDNYFELWLGHWPTCIDWTGAVLNTHLTASLTSVAKLSREFQKGSTATKDSIGFMINLVEGFFGHSTAYYFGENAFSIRAQAYDDMQWVVLGWLEGIKFTNVLDKQLSNVLGENRTVEGPPWHGTQWHSAFAHRAHIFYDLVQRGWDSSLCGGGLTWNPHLTTYKNTITNTLFLSSSVGMYLYHPGDSIRSPFLSSHSGTYQNLQLDPTRPHDPEYLHFAIAVYDWLQNVNMTNTHGLYVDGYHLSNETKINAPCDVRDEMVYSYNQGVILSGLRQLWESTGDGKYLEDGHRLVRNVVRATGWNTTLDFAGKLGDDDRDSKNPGIIPGWHGLGRNGILEDACDASGTCTQDGQSFKGIFFHHLTALCQPLPTAAEGPLVPGVTFVASRDVASLHEHSCRSYIRWIGWNAQAALETKNEEGLFGMWWGAGRAAGQIIEAEDERIPVGAIDTKGRRMDDAHGPRFTMHRDRTLDINDRGLGRTVETQSGGLAVLRSLWEFLAMYG